MYTGVGILTHDDSVTGPISRRPIMTPVILRCPHLPDSLLFVSHALMLEASNTSVIPIVVFKSVWLLAVDSIVTNLQHLVGHSQRHTADEFDETHDQRGPDNVPTDDEESADNLETNLSAIAKNSTARVGDTESSTAFGSRPETWSPLARRIYKDTEGKHTGANTSDDSANEMSVENIQCIIDLTHDLGSTNNVH